MPAAASPVFWSLTCLMVPLGLPPQPTTPEAFKARVASLLRCPAVRAKLLGQHEFQAVTALLSEEGQKHLKPIPDLNGNVVLAGEHIDDGADASGDEVIAPRGAADGDLDFNHAGI